MTRQHKIIALLVFALAVALPAWGNSEAAQDDVVAVAKDEASYRQRLAAANAGDARMQFELGRMAEQGTGRLAANPREALRWYRLAAEKGHADAQFALAQAYATGRGVMQDQEEAVFWLNRAAKQNHAPSLIELARLHEEGAGVRRNQAWATELIRRAAAAGNPAGQYLYSNRLEVGAGVAQNKRAAWAWLRRAAENGYPAAMARLGQTGDAGTGTSVKEALAAYLLLSASNPQRILLQ
jgi:TPR repeat protein